MPLRWNFVLLVIRILPKSFRLTLAVSEQFVDRRRIAIELGGIVQTFRQRLTHVEQAKFSRSEGHFCEKLLFERVAQFVGGMPRASAMSVKAARAAPIDTYVVVTGSIVAHLREDYYTFRDATGDIRVEISDRVWSGRPVTPKNTVRLVAEVDRNSSGLVYLWVQWIEIVK